MVLLAEDNLNKSRAVPNINFSSENNFFFAQNALLSIDQELVTHFMQ